MSTTPGPWVASPHGDGWHIVAHTPQKAGSAIFTRVATAHGMKGNDAKLIAAAPDLARTLRLYVELFAVSREPVGEPYSIERKNQDFRIAQEDIAREILAKAGVL